MVLVLEVFGVPRLFWADIDFSLASSGVVCR